MPRTGVSHAPLELSSAGQGRFAPEAHPIPSAAPSADSSAVDTPTPHRQRSTRALILVGHGSHLNADSSAPVYAHAAALRASGVFDEVHEAFWKEEPPLTAVLDLSEADEVLIIPLFLSEGYFTREVLPREMGLQGPVTRRGKRTFRYLSPVGTHPAMAGMILGRARSVLGESLERRQQATLVVIGHGTERNATSADTVYSLVERLRLAGDFAAVTCGFLDEAPHIGDVIASTTTPDVVLVPFFVAEGWHTRETIPAELGLEGDVTRKGDQTIWYTPPVGTLPEMAEVILEMAEESEGAEDWDAPSPAADADPSDERLVREAMGARGPFFAQLRAASGPVRLMDVVIERVGEGAYRLRHYQDLSLDIAALQGHDDPEMALQIGRFRADGSYRAMRTSTDLRTGWVFPSLDEEGLWRVLARLYPAAIQAWHQGLAQERLPPKAYGSWASRQTAMYADVRKLTFDDVEEVIGTLCVACHRRRVWTNVPSPGAPSDPEVLAGESSDRGDRPDTPSADELFVIPCREPCTLFATHAREFMLRRRGGQNVEG